MRALRDHDFSDEEYVQAGILNELRLLRVDQAAVHGQTMKPILVNSPAQQKAEDNKAANRREVQRTISKRLRGKT